MQTMRETLSTPASKRWRYQVGVAGAEAIEDGEPLTPAEAAAAQRQMQAFLAWGANVTDALRPMFDELLKTCATPAWHEVAASAATLRRRL